MHALNPSFSRSNTARNTRVLKVAGGVAAGLLVGLLVGRIAYADESISHWDKNFLVSAIESDYAEIKASELALQKSANPDVKSFAQKMIDGHSKTSEQLKGFATQKNVTAPTQASAVQRTKIDLLGNLSGASFDKHYANMVVTAHQDAIKLFEKADTKSKDADIKQFASTTLPVLHSHLAMANDLNAKVESAK